MHVALAATVGLAICAAPATAAGLNTSITSGPAGLIASKSATFKFKASAPGATFQCKLDAQHWALCTSPKKYSKLAQGPHTFSVRARKGKLVDRTPATRHFSVDTLAPNSTISGPADQYLAYPNGYTEDQTPESVFGISGPTEPVTFECRITPSGEPPPPFAPCGTPYSPTDPLSRDAFYTIEARAIDKAGNADPTPASWEFDVETPITDDLATAEAAATLYFPDTANMDAPATCGNTPIDCPGGSPLPPDPDQVSTTSARSVVAVPDANRYDVTVTHHSQTLSPVVVTAPIVGDCDLTWNSDSGTTNHWTITASLNVATGYPAGMFVPGGKYIAPQNTSVSGIESQDYVVAQHGGGFGCGFSDSSFYGSFLVGHYPTFLGADRPLCPKLGPGYLTPCTALP